ncbi:TetR/AcrR family transcriptional regulator [Aureispira anguillae]|uniref:TetR/AcrR family transcriptional regulator n=1 Tax=Aureispira anguillae TaxID=2864201 RepID=A0A916DR76_9BACT|nr:TetR/AcrR family transcriptional regulator [Aureispira anguillae]BDS11121.1 TetR/AcrR family transcriptional regulator [Aureispira anguillae]
MPKETFDKLPEEKREAFIKAFLEEFATKNYDKASISVVVKKLKIAKGSVYQYFENKLDLYLYLKSLCEGIKMNYVLKIDRADYPDFWDYYRAQYEAGIQFDLAHPLESQFLYRIGEKETSEILKGFMKEWKQKAIQAYRFIIQAEIDKGYFRNDISAETMTYFLVSVSMGIGDVLRAHYQIDFDKNIEEGKPVFALDKTALMKAVEDHILLLKGALNKQ